MGFLHESSERHTFQGQHLTHLDHIISRIVVLAKLPGNKCRSEVAKELSAHLEDIAEEVRSQGYDGEAAARIVTMRFGEPQEITAAFSAVYASERWARRILQSTILFAASAIAVAVVVSTVQAIAAMCTATSVVSTLRDIYREVFGFGTITAGYCSVYAGERFFPTCARAALPSVTLGLCLAAGFTWLIPQHAALSLVAFVCAASARLLQRVEIPFIWFVGTALPLLVAWAWFGPLVSGWQFPWLVWLGLTTSCKALREVVRLFEKVFIDDFA